MTEVYLHRSAYKKWQKGGRSDLTEEEYLILEKHAFRPYEETVGIFGQDEAITSKHLPQDPALRVNLLLQDIQVLKERGDLADAENHLRTIVSNYPRSHEVLKFMALFLQFDQHNQDEAEVFFRKAIIFNPRSAETHAHIGLIEHLNGEDRKAEESYRKALMQNSEGPLPRCAQALSSLPFVRSEAYTIIGALMEDRYADLEAAEALYRRGATTEPPCPRAAYRLGALLHHLLDRPAEAAPWYRRAADTPGAPADAAAPALVGLGLLLLDSDGGGSDAAEAEARDLFGRAAELAPDDPAPHFFCGALLHERGELLPAVAAYRRAADCPVEPRRAADTVASTERP